MAKKDEPQGVQCENVDIELLRRQLTRLETTLSDKFSEIRNLIDEKPTQQPVFPPPAEPIQPLPVEVNLPDDLARSEDISRMTGIVQTMNSTVSLVMQGLAELKKAIEALPKQDNNTLARTAIDKMEKNFLSHMDEKIDKGLSKAYTNGQTRATGISHDEASAINSRLDRIEDSISVSNTTAKKNRIIRFLSYCLVGTILLAIGFCWYGVSVSHERNELLRIEWLYRLKRAISSNADFINRAEKEILRGTEKDFGEWKSIIVDRESSGPEFIHFSPHDDWKPKPKKEEPKPQQTPPKSASQKTEKKPLPHERKSQLTPGEIDAYKAMRANPHIPDDAKPPLPDGY